MVAHLWAHEQEESASGSNFFFEGTSIYSYGHHFEVGRIVKESELEPEDKNDPDVHKVYEAGMHYIYSN